MVNTITTFRLFRTSANTPSFLKGQLYSERASCKKNQHNNVFVALFRLPQYCVLLALFADAAVGDFYALMRKKVVSCRRIVLKHSTQNDEMIDLSLIYFLGSSDFTSLELDDLGVLDVWAFYYISFVLMVYNNKLGLWMLMMLCIIRNTLL